MSKTQEELTQLKSDYEEVKNKHKELSNNELEKVAGGINLAVDLPTYFSMHPDLYNTYTNYR